MTEHDEVPTELAELITAERAAAVAPTAERAAIRAKIAASAGKAALGQAAASTAFGGAGKVIAVIAIMAAGGAAALIARGRSDIASPPKTSAPSQEAQVVPPPDPTPIAPVTESVVAAPAAPAAPPVAAPSPQAAPPVAVVSRPARTVTVVPSAPSPAAATIIPSQPELVRRAWAALKSADAAGALAIVKQDRTEHPDGPLEEERDAIEVLALIKLQPGADASAVAAGFLDRYPASIHRGLIERAIAERKEVR